MKTKLKRRENGLYEGPAFYGLKATVERDDDAKDWGWMLWKPARTEWVSTGDYTSEKVEHPMEIVANGTARTKADAEKAIDEYGRTTMVTVTNIMSGNEFETPIGVAGTFLCPSSESYWSM